MSLIPVQFEYITGIRHQFLSNTRLIGSWDGNGHYASQWTTVNMQSFTADDDCPAFQATVNLDDSQIGQEFRWRVTADASQQQAVSAIPTEVNDRNSRLCERIFTLRGAGQIERYYLTHCRRLGANKLVRDGQPLAIRFAVWAPNAQNVELVRGTYYGPPSEGRATVYIAAQLRGGYVANNGDGVIETLPMHREEGGIWATDIADSPRLQTFSDLDHTPYMFRITKDDGRVAYRTDLYSRCQIGSGGTNPESSNWSGLCRHLDGSKSCSVVIDPELVTEDLQELDQNQQRVFPETRWLTEDAFWQDEFRNDRPLPSRIEDLVIYELHVGGLGFGRVDENGQPLAGTLEDALNIIDHLVDVGINCIELMPMSEFEQRSGWGYTTSHYMAIEYAGGGRDQFKHLVRECHRRGIAVLLDVVYNHYAVDAERAEWMYDSNAHERNIYYWYEGYPGDYPAYEEAARNGVPDTAPGHGGYLNNGSSGYTPRFWDEAVRKMFCSSAAALVSEFHFDGFRVDLTTALHRDNNREADGVGVPSANQFGAKFLREWTRTLKLIKPNVFLIAEDHSTWDAVTRTTDQDGLGFDAKWFADYYHNLIGDARDNADEARLINTAGAGGDGPLALGRFADRLRESATGRVVYHESHDEAGGGNPPTARTIAVAIGVDRNADYNDSLINQFRSYAEGRVHFAAGVTLLGPGIPMFFMGEEVGCWQPYRYNDFLNHRDDIPGLRGGAGANLFNFYCDLIRLRLAHSALRSHNVEILWAHDVDRVLAFRRWDGGEELLVIGSLNNAAFGTGYRRMRELPLADGEWREIFNSDALIYGGTGLFANPAPVVMQNGAFAPIIPANSVLVFQR